MKNYKIVFVATLTLLTCTVIFSACRKKILREEATLPTVVEHCSNSIMDEDELGTDCGGAECDSCLANIPPCELPENRLRMLHGPFIQNLTLYNTSHSIVGSHWFFRAYTDESDLEYIEFEFPSKPNLATTYAGQLESSFIEQNEVFIQFHGYSSADMFGKGDVYVNLVGESYVISSCDYSFRTWGGSPLDGQYFNIPFN